MKTSRSRGKNVGGGKWGNTDSYFKTTDTHNSTQNNCLPPSRKWKQKKKKKSGAVLETSVPRSRMAWQWKKKKAHHERTVINECTLKKVTRVKLAHIMIQCFCVSRCFHLTHRRRKRKKKSNKHIKCVPARNLHPRLYESWVHATPDEKKKKRCVRRRHWFRAWICTAYSRTIFLLSSEWNVG